MEWGRIGDALYDMEPKPPPKRGWLRRLRERRLLRAGLRDAGVDPKTLSRDDWEALTAGARMRAAEKVRRSRP